jgi:hypothetical protein
LFFNLVLLDMRPQIMLYFQQIIIAILKSFSPVIFTSRPHLFTFNIRLSNTEFLFFVLDTCFK